MEDQHNMSGSDHSPKLTNSTGKVCLKTVLEDVSPFPVQLPTGIRLGFW